MSPPPLLPPLPRCAACSAECPLPPGAIRCSGSSGCLLDRPRGVQEEASTQWEHWRQRVQLELLGTLGAVTSGCITSMSALGDAVLVRPGLLFPSPPACRTSTSRHASHHHQAGDCDTTLDPAPSRPVCHHLHLRWMAPPMTHNTNPQHIHDTWRRLAACR